MADEQLKSLGKSGIDKRTFSQRGHIYRVHGNESGLDELLLHPLVKDLIQGVTPGLVRRFRQLHPDSLGGGYGLLVGGNGHKVDAAILLDGLVHRHTGPAGGQVDFFSLPLHLVSTQDLLGSGGKQILEQVHHVVEVGISLVQLDGSKLRVVLGVHPLVAEDAPDLVYPVHAAYDEPLQGQLGGDAHIHIDVQGIVVGDEGPGGGAARDGVEHRGLHLHIATAVHKVPDMLDELGANDEVALHLRIDDQIHIALAVAQLGVGQAVEFLRQGQQGLREQRHSHNTDGHLSPLGAKNYAVDSYDIADIILLKAVILRLIHLVLPGVELDAAGLVLQVAEGHLAHPPLGHEAAGDGHLPPLQGVEVALDVGGVVIHYESGDLEGIVPPLLELLQLVPADLQELGEVLLLGGVLVVLVILIGHIANSYPLYLGKITAPPSGSYTLPDRRERPR